MPLTNSFFYPTFVEDTLRRRGTWRSSRSPIWQTWRRRWTW